MPKAIADPEEIRRFAQDLQRANNDLQAMMSSLHSRFRKLSESWRDQERDKFSESFEATAKALRGFIEESQRLTPFLLRKASRLEEYLEQR